nr:leucine-rich repeat protein [uncultured Ruminococcus sp.]
MSKCKIKLRSSISVILSVLIVLSAAMCVPVTASAATYDSNPDNFEFSYNSSDMTASVTKYKGDSEYVEIPSMVNGYKVDSIGNIFRDNYKLKGVIIPDTVDYVSRGIFSGCVSLTDVDLGKGITKISSGMFYNCKSLESLTIPEQIEEFEYIPYIDGDYYRRPFDGCTSLKNLYLKAKDISSISYLNLPSLTNIVIASTVDSLPNDAFSGYNYIENVTFENGLMVLPDSCFKNCTSLKDITLPDSMMSVGKSAFENCFNLKSVTFSKNLNTISPSAFKGCSSIESLNFNDNLREIGSNAFENCTSVKNVTFNNLLNTIGESAFSNCTSIEKAELPSSVSSLGENAFAGCTGLKNVTLSEKLKYISSGAFSDCNSLESIDLPDNITEIGLGSFLNCTALQNVKIGKNTTTIERYAFLGCSSLKSIEIPANVKYICESAFEDCTNLSSVKLNNGLQQLDNYVFYNCLNLKKIIIPASVTYLSDYSLGYYGKNDNNYKIPDFVIVGDINSCAQRYANNNGFKFEEYKVNLSTPQITSLKNTTGGVKITWNKVDGAYGYRLYYRPASGGWKRFKDTTATSFTDSGVTANKTETYTIRCIDKNGNTISGFNSNGWSIKYVPVAPTISKLENTSGGIKLTWNKIAGVYGYRLYYKPASGGWKRFKDTTSTSFTDSSVVPNKTETYTIRCLDKDGNTISGFNSNGWSIKYVPVAPTISKLENTLSGIKLTWNKIAGVYGYRLYRKTSTGWKRFKDTTATSFTDSAVSANQTKTYTIRCIDKDGKTVSGFNSKGWSKKYTASTPSISKLENTSGGIKLSWNKVTGAYGYRLYRKTSSGWKRIKDTTATTYTDSAVKSGRTETYTIRCIDRNGKTVSGYNSKGWSKKYVYNQPKSIKLNKTSAYIGKKESVTLKYTLSAGSTSTVTWSSSNKNVATVSGGKVTAKGAGTTTITATTANGKKATCKVTVINGVRKQLYVNSYRVRVCDFSVVVPDSCTVVYGNDCVVFVDKYNKNKYGSGTLMWVTYSGRYSTSKEYSLGYANRTKIVYQYPLGAGVGDVTDKTASQKYQNSKKDMDLAIKNTFRFE